MLNARTCRIAYLVKDLEAHHAAFARILGMPFRKVDTGDYPLSVLLDQHGFEAIQTFGFSFAPIEGPFIELALSLSDADLVKDRLAAIGIPPIAVNHIDVTDHDEYLFGPGFHGIPLMIAYEGDQEASIPPCETLEKAPPPKLGHVVLRVENLDAALADMGKILEMAFVPADPAGLGTRAAVGGHRVKLVEGASDFQSQFTGPLAAYYIVYPDVEAARRRIEENGYRVLSERPTRSGRKSYYFGQTFDDMPIGIYDVADEDEMLGR